MIYTSIKQLKAAADLQFKDLKVPELGKIADGKIKEVACYCKYGYTQASLFYTCIGLVYCNSYMEYCNMLDLKYSGGFSK